MSVERFEVGKTYRSGGCEFVCEWVGNLVGRYQQVAGQEDGLTLAGVYTPSDWAEVKPTITYTIVVEANATKAEPGVGVIVNRNGAHWAFDGATGTCHRIVSVDRSES